MGSRRRAADAVTGARAPRSRRLGLSWDAPVQARPCAYWPAERRVAQGRHGQLFADLAAPGSQHRVDHMLTSPQVLLPRPEDSSARCPHQRQVASCGSSAAPGSPPTSAKACGTYPRRRVATSVAQYVKMMPAPARLMAVSDSVITRSRSSQPLAAAASTIAYSPLT